MSPELCEDITDYLFNTNLSVREIAKELYITEAAVRENIKALGLGWVRRKAGMASRGQAALTAIMRKLIPGEQIITEAPLGDRLRLDVYCPKYQLAAEYHGRQHFEYVEYFHGNIQGFYESQQRDDKKAALCREQGIALVVFRYNESLEESLVYERILDTLILAQPYHGNGHDHKPTNPFYEAWKKRKREYAKEQYRKMKRR